jgi:hypothetical protein
LPALVLLVSLVLFHHAILFSGFALTPSGVGDSMLVNYALEHDYRWLTGNRLHHSLWSPPIFYPQRDTAAYTDLILGALPPYAVWRLFGAGPATAFELWVITVSALNFLAAYWLLSHVLECGWIGGSAGALLLAFGSPRQAQLAHLQLWPAFYTIVAFAGVCMLFPRDPGELTRRQAYAGLTLFLGGFCLQLYTAFYYAWFMAFTITLGVVFSFLLPGVRSRLLSFLRTWWRASLCAGVLAALAMAPYVAIASNVMKQVGGYPYSYLTQFLPSAQAWLAQGPHHLLYGGLNRLAGIGPNYGSQEMFNGIGLFTTALVIGGLVLFRERTLVRLWGCIGLSVILLSVVWPGGHSLWRFIYGWFPGAAAIRAVGRFSVYLLMPASIIVAFTIDRVGARFSRIAAIVCLLAVGLEQAGSLQGARNYVKAEAQASIDEITRQIRPECSTLLFSWNAEIRPPRMHVLGMWAELATGVPTLNGYSGQFPPNWPLGDITVSNPAERKRVLENIKLWTDAHPADFTNVCWVLPDGSVPPRKSLTVLSMPMR